MCGGGAGRAAGVAAGAAFGGGPRPRSCGCAKAALAASASDRTDASKTDLQRITLSDAPPRLIYIKNGRAAAFLLPVERM
jgi:hypothetical protein